VSRLQVWRSAAAQPGCHENKPDFSTLDGARQIEDVSVKDSAANDLSSQDKLTLPQICLAPRNFASPKYRKKNADFDFPVVCCRRCCRRCDALDACATSPHSAQRPATISEKRGCIPGLDMRLKDAPSSAVHRCRPCWRGTHRCAGCL
jgi:hypothetical protein